MYYLCMCILVAVQRVIACTGFHDTNNFLKYFSYKTYPFLHLEFFLKPPQQDA
jgi:hypothetical protein